MQNASGSFKFSFASVKNRVRSYLQMSHYLPANLLLKYSSSASSSHYFLFREISFVPRLPVATASKTAMCHTNGCMDKKGSDCK